MAEPIVNKIAIIDLPAPDIFQRAKTQLREIAAKPEQYLNFSHRFFFAAGHAAVLWGKEESRQWQDILAGEKNGQITWAGVSFSKDEFIMMGNFARFLDNKGKIGRCVDERLDQNTKNGQSGIHDGCGALNAAASNIGKTGVDFEDQALHETRDQFELKAPLMPGMEHEHEAVAVLVDLTGKGAHVNQHKLEGLRHTAALPFHASIPLDEILDFTKNQEEAQKLVVALTKLNVRIPFQIMRGNHNLYHRVVANQGFLLIEDQRGVAANAKQLALLDIYRQTVEGLKGQQKVEILNINN